VKDAKRFAAYNNRTLVLLFIISFAMSIGMNAISPVWPLYIMSLGATVLEASYVISLSGMAGVFLTTPSGLVSDKIGRRMIILASITLAIVSPLFYILARDWRELILWATIYGLAFAIFMPTRNAWIADLVEPEDRAAAYSFLNMAFPLGNVVGPLLGGMIVDRFGWRDLFLLAAITSAFSLPLALGIRKKEDRVVTQERLSVKTSLRREQVRTLLFLLLLQFLLGFGFGLVSPMIPIYLTERFGSTATEIGVFTMIGFGVTAFLAQIPNVRLADRLGRGKLILYSCAIIPLTFFLWSSRTEYFELLVLYMVATAAWCMTWPCTASILMDATPSSRRGLFSGLSLTGVTLGFTIGPAVAGTLWEDLGHQAPFYVSSFIFAVSVPTALLLERSRRSLKFR